MSEKELLFEGNLPLQPVSEPSQAEHPLMLKDRWHGEKDLGMRVNQHGTNRTIYFGYIRQDWFKDLVKRYILYSRGQGKSFSTLARYINALQSFAHFLETQCIYSFEDITDEIFSEYFNQIKGYAENTRIGHLSYLKTFLELGTINGWFKLSTYWFRGKMNRAQIKSINYIPDEVFRQLDKHLHLLPDPLQRMVLLIRTTGIRACELLLMRFDCLRQRQDGNWEIHFTNWKFNEQPDILTIIPELAEIIKEQQSYIRKHLGDEFEYLFCANTPSSKKFKPQPKVMKLGDFNRSLNQLAQNCNICDKSGRCWHFSSHQFRRTVATKMTNAGVRQYIIQSYLRHKDSNMMQHYAQVLPETLKTEFEMLYKRKKIVDITGAEVSSKYPELDNNAGLQWLRSKMQPKALMMGFCARPQLLKPCPHADGCLSCQHYRVDENDLPAMKQHLERNRQLKTEWKSQGYTRQLKAVEQEEKTLLNMIQALETANG